MHNQINETTETRFGRMEPPAGYIPHDDFGPRRTIPHMDDRYGAPQPSDTAKVLTYAGIGVMAAALTAGTVLAGRKLLHAVSDDAEARAAADRSYKRTRRLRRAARQGDYDDYPVASLAAMEDDDRHAMERRVRRKEIEDDAWRATQRAQAMRRRHTVRDNRNIADQITDTAGRLSGNVDGVMRSLMAAVAGFRMVANQAGAIMDEFDQAAGTVRGVMRRASDTVDRVTQPLHQDPPQDPRTHRL